METSYPRVLPRPHARRGRAMVRGRGFTPLARSDHFDNFGRVEVCVDHVGELLRFFNDPTVEVPTYQRRHAVDTEVESSVRETAAFATALFAHCSFLPARGTSTTLVIAILQRRSRA